MAMSPAREAFDLLLFAYDRRQLHSLEFLTVVRDLRTPDLDARHLVRFINENGFDSGAHGGVQVLGLGEFVFHFNCQGPASWNAVRSFTRVRGAFDFLEGRDSQGRAVRMACLGFRAWRFKFG